MLDFQHEFDECRTQSDACPPHFPSITELEAKSHRLRQLAALIAIAALALLSACGAQNSMAPAITVTFTPGFTPPATLSHLSPDNTAGIAVTITNGPQNAVVNWSVTCGSASCGSFAPTATASTIPTTYTAPASIPAGNTVTVKATSKDDPTKSVSAIITID